MNTPLPSQPPSASNFSRDLIKKEIAHLKKGRSTRYSGDVHRARSGLLLVALALLLLGLYALDPILYSYNRGDAIRVYLYLHNYGNDRLANAVATCGLLKPGEVRALNHRQGAFQDYFSGTEAAERKAAELIAYMKGVHDLHERLYDALSPLNKIRYVLFMKTGLTPPVSWDILDSSIDP